MNNQERIDAYIRKEMNDAERKDFESDLKNDASLYEEYVTIKNVVSALKKRNKRMQQMSEWKSELEEHSDISIWNVVFNRKIYPWIGGCVAACLIVMFLAVPKIRTNDEQGDFVSMSSGEIMTSDSDMLLEKLFRLDSLESAYVRLLHQRDSIDNVMIEPDSIVQNLYEVRWEKVNILISLNRKDEAMNLLFMFINKDGKYQRNAKKLWNELNK